MEPVNNSDFQQGYERGLENTSASAVKEKLSAQSNYKYAQESLIENGKQREEVSQRLAKTIEKHRTINSGFQKYANQLKHKTDERAELKHKISIDEHNIAALHEQKASQKSPYTLLAGVLYLLAGFAFLAGDLIISHEIVAYALNIRNTIEAWAFAIGLASLSILLKPAYERLVEQPYLRGEGKKVYSYFQSGLLVLSMLTLIVLGWFRYEAYKTDKLKEAINREIKTMQLEATPIDPTVMVDNGGLLSKIDEKLAASNALTIELVNSPLAMFSFILTGLLFAVAGAICLGIAFPILQVFWIKGLQLNPAIRKSRRNIRRAEKLLVPINAEIAKLNAAHDIHAQEIAYLDDLDFLKKEEKRLAEEAKELYLLQRESMTAAIQNNVEDGYLKGAEHRTEMTDEEYENYRKVNHQNKRRVQSPASSRPHEALRKVIADQFGEN